MEALWPELDPAAAANNLHQVVHVARRALGADAVELREELLTLQRERRRRRLRARRAGRRAAPARAGAYRAAMSLYAGELLPENRYDDWASARREELEQLHGELLEARARRWSGDERVSALPPQASSFVGRRHELRELQSRRAAHAAADARRRGRRRQDAPRARAGARGRALASPTAPRSSSWRSVADGQLVGRRRRRRRSTSERCPGRSLLEGVADFLAQRSMLLILDNCEHVLRASAPSWSTRCCARRRG